jgi:hypothetical protein
MSDESLTTMEERSRALFEDSVGRVDMRVRSRLTRARHAALEAAAAKRSMPRLFGLPSWTPAAGVTAAAVLGAALWLAPQMMGNIVTHGAAPVADGQAYEDLDIVASTDEMELLQDDPEFYDWAEKVAGPDSGSDG